MLGLRKASVEMLCKLLYLRLFIISKMILCISIVMSLQRRLSVDVSGLILWLVVRVDVLRQQRGRVLLPRVMRVRVFIVLMVTRVLLQDSRCMISVDLVEWRCVRG